jgi:hypothetical protein
MPSKFWAAAKILPKFWAAKILGVTQWLAKTTVPVSIRGVLIWKRAGRQKKSHLGTPRYQKEFVPIRELTYLLIAETTMKLLVHKVNSGALVLVKTLPQQFTPQSKY